MKKLILTATLIASMVSAQVTVTRIKRQLETSTPASIQLDLRHGESVDFDLQFLSYGTAMDITGSTVTLHATTNGMAAGTSFQISGTAGSNGTASVRISVDEWLPYTLTAGTWTLECAQTNAASRIMRASGSLKVSGLYYPSTNSPLPVSWATNLWTAIATKVSTTDATYTSTVSKASSAFSWGTHAGLYRLIDWVPEHSALGTLDWVTSAHTGTPARIAGFFEGGAAGYAGFGPGMYLDGSDNISVSNDVISGAALGATALQNESDTNAIAQLIFETNRSIQAEAVLRATNNSLVARVGNIETNTFVDKLYTTSHAQYIDGDGKIWRGAYETTNSMTVVTNFQASFVDFEFYIESPVGLTNNPPYNPFPAEIGAFWRLYYEGTDREWVMDKAVPEVLGSWKSVGGDDWNILVPFTANAYGTAIVSIASVETNYDITIHSLYQTDRLATTSEVSNAIGEGTNNLWNAALATFPLKSNMPSNSVTGWLVYDTGSNDWLRVQVSNRSFTVWGITP